MTVASKTGVQKLERLFAHLDGLTERATVEQITLWLREAAISAEDVADHVHFGENGYLRNLVHEGAHYHVLVLCWRSGQRSPIHNHAGSTCGLTVLEGTATETVFEHAPCNLVKAVSSSDLSAGSIGASQDGDTHQVSNLQTSGDDLITLHVYSPPLLRMASYSLTEPHVGEFRPMVLAHVDGSGI